MIAVVHQQALIWRETMTSSAVVAGDDWALAAGVVLDLEVLWRPGHGGLLLWGVRSPEEPCTRQTLGDVGGAGRTTGGRPHGQLRGSPMDRAA